MVICASDRCSGYQHCRVHSSRFLNASLGSLHGRGIIYTMYLLRTGLLSTLREQTTQL